MRIDRYEVRGELGRGGMGVVYVAHDPELGRDVALKLSTATAKASQRADREAESLARLRHPNIVGLHTAGVVDGHRFLVMELVEGESLQDRLDRGAPLAPREAVVVARGIAAALDHAHGQGVLHRDVKPSNVLLTPDGTPRLTDFGLARTLLGTETRLSQSGRALGTPGYMAPEQILGERAGTGPATDVYGVGGLLYAALTCRPPVEGETLVELMASTVGLDPDPPSRHNPEVDAVLDALILRCLEKSPGERFPDCATLGQALDAYLRGELPVLRRRRRRRAATLLFVVATLVVVALWGVRVLGRLRSEEQVTRLLALAATALSEGDPATSLRACERALAQVPDSAGALIARGDAHAAVGEFDAALADYVRARELAPESPLPLAHRAALLLDPASEEHRRDFQRALELDPDCALALALRGLDAVRLRQPAGGVADLTRALELDPRCALVFATRGVIHRGAGRAAESRADLDRALELQPRLRMALVQRAFLRIDADPRGALQDAELALRLQESYLALTCRAQAHAALDDPAAALVDLDRALELEPKNPAALLARARLRLLTSAYEGAAEDMRVAVELKPDLALNQLLLGTALSNLADQQEAALAALSRALELDPTMTFAHLQRAGLYSIRGEYEEARADYVAFLVRFPNDANAHRSLGLAHKELGDHEAAVAAFTRAVECDPSLVDAYQGRGQARVALSELAAALDDFTQVIALDSQNSEAYFQRGMVHLRRSACEEAIQDFDGALRVRPRWAPVLVNRAVAWRLLERYDRAEEDLTRAISADPTSADAHTARGFLRAQFVGDLQGALSDHLRATQLAPVNASAWLHLANVRGQLGDMDGARTAYDQCLELDPDQGVARHDRGRFRLEHGDYAGAEEDLQRALEFLERSEPGSTLIPEIREQLKQVHAELQKP